MPNRVERRMHMLALARDCASLGARVRTIHHITGVSPRELLRLLFDERSVPPRGRAPDTREWYHSANLLCRAEASVIVANFRRLRQMEFPSGESLVSAYRYYQSVCHCPHRISFDRAFDLASHTDGIWVAKAPSFSVVPCPACASEYVDTLAIPGMASGSCPFCKLLRRLECDPRVQASFPPSPPVSREAALDLLHRLHLLHEADAEIATHSSPLESALARHDLNNDLAAGRCRDGHEQEAG